MALSIGELSGYLTLDDSKFEQGLDGAKSKFDGLGGWLKDNGKKLGLAAGAAVGAAVTAGLAANINAGKANDRLAAQLGLSAKESGRAGKIAGGLYRDAYGDSLEGVNEAVGAVMTSIKGMSTASAKDLEAVTAKALNFATTFDVDVPRAVQVAGQVISTGLASNATQAFDLITAASQKVPSALREDLLDASDEYGQFFAGLGYDGKQAFSILVDASEKGMYGIDKAGDAIKEFSIRATDLNDTGAQQAFKTLGLSGEDMGNKILAGGKSAQSATQTIIDSLLSIKDPSKQAAAATALFGTPLEDMNKKDIPAFLESLQGMSGSLGDVKGAAKRSGDTLNDNFDTRMEGWKRTVMGFVQDGLMKLADVGGSAFDWASEHRGAVIGMTSAMGALVAVTLAHQLVLASSSGTLSAWLAQTLLVRGAVAAWAAVQWVANGAMAAFNLVLSLNPIALIVLALVALGAGLVLAYQKSETFRSVVSTAWHGIQAAAKFAWEQVIKPVFGWLKAGLGHVGDAFVATRDGIKAAWGWIQNSTQLAVLWIVDKVLWFAEKILSAGVKAFGWAPGIGDKVKDALAEVRKLRTGTNAEMDRIKNEDVKISLKTTLSSISSGLDRFLDSLPGGGGGGKGGKGAIGGGGPIPRRSAAVGGGGPVPRVSAPMAPVRKAANTISDWRHVAAMKQAHQVQDVLKKMAASGLGPPGAAGRVLPRGRYSIGMPWHGYPGHNGADYPAAIGTPVYAPWSGRVTRSYDLPGANRYNSTPYRSYGRVVQIAYANGMTSLFAHLSSRIGRLGTVAAGTMVGRVGMNGNATGPHLHAEFNGGRTNPATLGLFDTGGLARGAGLLAKGPQPERILSTRQTVSFERLVTSLDGSGSPQELHINREDLEWLAEIILDGSQRIADGTLAQARRRQQAMRTTAGAYR